MIIDWNIVASISTAFGAVATGLGVLFGAWQIMLSKHQSQAEFEDSIDQQYRSLSMSLPVDVLIGKKAPEDKESEIRELIYNYLDLCNEQAYLRSKYRVTASTWDSWGQGMKAHLARPAFSTVYTEVSPSSSFTHLDRLVSCNFSQDPVDWKT